MQYIISLWFNVPLNKLYAFKEDVNSDTTDRQYACNSSYQVNR